MKQYKHYLLIFLFFVCFNPHSYGQLKKSDSLLLQLNKSIDKRERIHLLLKISSLIYNEFPDSSFVYGNQADSLAIAFNYYELSAQAKINKARVLILKGDIGAALNLLNNAAIIFNQEKNVKEIARIYSLKSVAVNKIGNSKEAIEFCKRAIIIYESLKDTSKVIGQLNNLSSLYIHQNMMYEAQLTLEKIKTLTQRSEHGNPFYFQYNQGLFYQKKNNLKSALNCFKNAFLIGEEHNMTDSKITALTSLGEVLFLMQNYQESESTLNHALWLSEKNNLILEKKEILSTLSHLYEKTGKFAKSLWAYKEFTKIKDSLFTLEKYNSVTSIEKKLKLTEKEKIITEQSLNLEMQIFEKQKAQNKAFYFSLALVIFILLLALVFFNFYKSKKLNKEILFQKGETEKQKEIIEIKNKEIIDSINYARRIQEGMLPSDKLFKEYFRDSFVLYLPKDIVAGDFYWLEYYNNMIYLAVCDCTGHGVPGAMVSVVANNSLQRAIHEFNKKEPNEILDTVSALMQETLSKNSEELSDGMDASLCRFDLSNKRIYCSSANNDLLMVRNGMLEIIKADKQPVGKFLENKSPFQLKSFDCKSGDMIYFFTDGYADQFGGIKGKKFKYKQLEELLLTISTKNGEEQKELVKKTFYDWKKEHEQVDDVLLIGIRI